VQFNAAKITLITEDEVTVNNIHILVPYIDCERGPKSMAYVLLVEDDDEHAGLVQRVLERDQHEIHILLDSSRILEVIKSRKPHIVVTDINMPHFDGIKVIEAVKKPFEKR
jgi:PleD family two-component response regulator